MALGKILGHNIHRQDGSRLMRKGKSLTPTDLAELKKLGRETIYVAEIEADDLDENTAASQLASFLGDDSIRLSKAVTGRVNLFAKQAGVFRVRVAELNQINSIEDVTVATLSTYRSVVPGKIVATVKILPYAIPAIRLHSVQKIAGTADPIMKIQPTSIFQVGLILSGSPNVRERIVQSFEVALRQRINQLGADIKQVDFVSLEEESDEQELAKMIRHQMESGCEMIILAGETAVMDRRDSAPRAIEQAGGRLICYGAPVDPGNLLLLAQIGSVPILGAPGCARSPKNNIVDLVLPRLLTGEILSHDDIIQFGHGGLLDDVPERPQPRSRLL